MPFVNLGEYLAERRMGNSILRSEDRLRELGLNVVKSQVAEIHLGPYGGVLHEFSLAFERRDPSFSGELTDFLEREVQLTPAQIQQLENQAMQHQ